MAGVQDAETGIRDTMKEEFINSLIAMLNGAVSDDQLISVKNALYLALQNYDLVKKQYEVSTKALDDEKLIQMFLISKKIDGLSDRTLKQYGSELRRLLHMYIHKSVLEYTKDDLRYHFAHRMIDRPELSKKTHNNERRYFSSFFAWLAENDYINGNPMAAIKKVKEDKVLRNPLSEEDIEKMRSCLYTIKARSRKGSMEYIKALRDSAIFEFLLSTGCRVSELTGAKLADLDIGNQEVKVFGKGAKERICYLNVKSIILLDEYLKHRNKESPYIFSPVPGDDDHLEKSAVEIMVRELGRKCGIAKVHPHRFRRTAATTALNKGMPIEEVQLMLGHESLDTTMIYARTKQKNVKASHEKYM